MVTFCSAVVTFLTIIANIKTPSGSSHKPDGHFTTLILSQFESRSINSLIHLLIEWLFETPSIMLCAVVLLLLLVTRLRVIALSSGCCWWLPVKVVTTAAALCLDTGHIGRAPASLLLTLHMKGTHVCVCKVRWTIPIHIVNKICTCRIQEKIFCHSLQISWKLFKQKNCFHPLQIQFFRPSVHVQIIRLPRMEVVWVACSAKVWWWHVDQFAMTSLYNTSVGARRSVWRRTVESALLHHADTPLCPGNN